MKLAKSLFLTLTLASAPLIADAQNVRNTDGTATQTSSDNAIISEDEALRFLYAGMPLPDSTDYSADYYRRQVRAALQAREEMPWGKSVPRREWMHFVLPVRVNNENLDDCRPAFFEQLKNRVKGMSMEEAALEVNHWCHEHVTYQPSDARTSSPLATVRSAIGRCGEESTFTVAALRSVGIPARQVYTPRWAHTDDNHAWVEVWVDGAWKFLGACEPEAVLNLGWFNAPASRAMLMHTKAFGHYDGPERVMSQTPCYTEIDVTDNYAPTASVVVKTTPGATVQFRLYNYAEFFPLSTQKADAQGLCTFASGKGSILVWATDGSRFGYSTVEMGQTDTLALSLEHLIYNNARAKGGKTSASWLQSDLNVTPPNERYTIPHRTPEQIDLNNRRLAYEDSLRTAYTNTFFDQERAIQWATWYLGNNAGRAEAIASLLVKSRGNHPTITDFLTQHKGDDRAIFLLQLLNDKDLRDVSADVLADHLDNSTGFKETVCQPRVSNEMLTPYRAKLQQAFSAEMKEKFVADPTSLEVWVNQNIRIDDSHNPQQLCMHPHSVLQHRITDRHSRNIFFVAVARSLGIESRLDEVTGKVQWRKSESDAWHDVFVASAVGSQPKGRLQLTYAATKVLNNPRYYTHFTLSKLVDGIPTLLNFPDNATWQQDFEQGIELDEGDYLLTTGTRLAKGGVLANMTFFSIRKGQTTALPITLRTSTDEVQVIGSFGSETRYEKEDGTTASILSTTGRGYYVIGRVAFGTEPTNHALSDISVAKADLEAWGRPIVLIASSLDEIKKLRLQFPNLPCTVHFGTDPSGAIAEGMEKAVQGEPATSLPTFLLADTFDRVVFMKQGYTIGLGEELLKVIRGTTQNTATP